MPAKQRVTLPTSSYAHIRQALWVLAGALVIIEGGERHELGTGDCLGLRSAGRGDLCQRIQCALHLRRALARS